MIDPVLMFVFPAAMALAACCDFFTMTIPNRLNLVFAALFFPAAFYIGLPFDQMALHVSAGAVMLMVGFSMFAFGWIGGGDAKFFAAVALWLGWGALAEYTIYVALFGGALTLFILFARRVPLPALLGRQEWAVRLHHYQSGIPYGIALAGAGLVIYPHTLWYKAFIF
ncbi:MAG: prepilin peptidase [Pseudomonadota bacterium]